ncbi:adhesin [Exiguobacterium artemiae]|uniref:adhesin n=1 Tax=Exiguobacterium artemiae TaxID=340145 RepID=UPI00296476AC|nr:adhesin [Exiguobacterium sibiricum]MDW2886495.1 adhesin [Exiguobacterium sibiricum]
MQITPEAVTYLKEQVKHEQAPGIRLYQAGQGCCGPSFGLGFGAGETGDQVKDYDGLALAIDGNLADVSHDITLALEETDQGPQIVLLGASNC